MISILIDSRSNRIDDFKDAMALTILGNAHEAEDEERERLSGLCLARHPHLKEEDMKSMERNQRLEEMASRVRELTQNSREPFESKDEALLQDIDSFVRTFSGLACKLTDCEDEKAGIIRLLFEMARHQRPKEIKSFRQKASLIEKFLNCFDLDEKDYARELIDLGRRSYRLRDDDNIYLGRIEFEFARSLQEAQRRLGDRCQNAVGCKNEEEIMKALQDRTYIPRSLVSKNKKKDEAHIKAGQLRGQPAAQGIARGKAHVIHQKDELLEFKSGEILVCDAIDPNMTFVVSLASAYKSMMDIIKL